MPPKYLKLPKPQSSAKKSRGKSNHKGDHLQLWSVENMRNALVLYISQRAPGYKGKVYGYKCVADTHHIPKEAFWCRVKGPLTGLFGYLAGGKGLTLEFPKLVHHLKWGKFCIFSVLFHFRIHISAASISSKIIGTVHLFLSQLCNFIYIWCEAPVSEYVLNSCNNFYLFQATGNPGQPSRQLIPGSCECHLRSTCYWLGPVHLVKGVPKVVELRLVHYVGVRSRRTHITVRKCLVVSLAGSKKCKF